ncbi:DUF3885 domain-containing protein [Roseibium sp. MB-4]
MQDIFERFRKVFGVERLPDGLFYQFEYGLRFELGGTLGMQQPIRRFVQAHQRSTKIAEAVFDNTDSVYALIVGYGIDGKIYSKFKGLKSVYSDFRKHNYAIKWDGVSGSADEYWYFHRVGSSWEIAELLWLDIAAEMQVRPAASNTRTYILDFKKAVILHAYDDRGLDLVSVQRSPLLKPYDEFRHWLLSHDIERIDRKFAS